MAGRKIDDHSNPFGKGSKESVFPKGVHVKSQSDDGDVGHLSKYEDTAEAIKSQQEMGVKKAKGLAQKPGHRN